MKLTPIIAALRILCPVFENRVAGAAQVNNLPDDETLLLPSAYVIPGNDIAGQQKSQTDYWQEITEGFSVVVLVSNSADEQSFAASFDVVDSVRQMLFKALLGWNPQQYGNPITYSGSALVEMNSAVLVWQFDFSVKTELTEEDTRQYDVLNNHDELKTLTVDIDDIKQGAGPDGNIEHHIEITLPTH